ncbi:MAG TPA: hypothetical protein VKP78_09420 [bacterium]|nr:hypothetical protein [bacterium]
MNLNKILRNTNLVFGTAVLLGFVFPIWANKIKFLIVPGLMTMMTFSLINFKFSELDIKDWKRALYLAGVNYILLTGLYILLAYILVENPLYQNAVIILGIMPPAVGIISLIYILKGDINTGFIAEVMGYVISLVAIPALTLFFFGESVTITRILNILGLVIVIPFLLSRALVYINSRKNILSDDITEIVVNLSYGLLFYITIGVNRDVFIHNFSGIIGIIALFIIMRFGLGALIYYILKDRIKREHNVLYVLFGTFKNGSAGMAITVMLFGVEATVPFAIFSIIASFYIIFLKWYCGK